MLLDDLMPRSEFASAHRIAVAAPPDRVVAAMTAVTPGEMPVARLLCAARWLPALPRGRRVLNVPSTPLHEQLLASGFVVLVEEPTREVVIGFVGQPWRLRRETVAVRDAAEFAAFARTGFVKGAVNFSADAVDGRALLRTETRVLPTDPAATGGSSAPEAPRSAGNACAPPNGAPSVTSRPPLRPRREAAPRDRRQRSRPEPPRRGGRRAPLATRHVGDGGALAGAPERARARRR